MPAELKVESRTAEDRRLNREPRRKQGLSSFDDWQALRAATNVELQLDDGASIHVVSSR
jgi:hypothetical protein